MDYKNKILLLLQEGCDKKEIAQRLALSKSKLSRLMRKLGLTEYFITRPLEEGERLYFITSKSMENVYVHPDGNEYRLQKGKMGAALWKEKAAHEFIDSLLPRQAKDLELEGVHEAEQMNDD